MNAAENARKQNGSYTARWSKLFQMYIAEQTVPDGPMGWAPYSVYYQISEETFAHFEEPDFDPKKHLTKPLFCTKEDYSTSPESKAYFQKWHDGFQAYMRSFGAEKGDE